MSKIVAEVISIGDELTSGQRLDTNSQWLSTQLADLGIVVQAHQTMGDYLEPMQAAFQTAAARSDLILVTGGLGPTQDDLTRQALATAFGESLEFDPLSWETIQQLFARRNVSTPPSNRIQAMFPSGSRPIPNPHGTAPGIDWLVNCGQRQVQFYCLPGVPVEMREMYAETIAPRLLERYRQGQVIVQRVIKTFGAGESYVESLLPNLVARGNDPQVGITASQATISLRLRTTAPDRATAEAKLEPVVQTIHQCLGKLVFGEGEQELEDVVVEELKRRGQRLVVVEWGTRGLVAQRLDEASGRWRESAEIAARGSAQVAGWLPTGGEVGICGGVILTHWESVRRWLAPEVEWSGGEPPPWPEVVAALSAVAGQRFQADLVLAGGPLPHHLDTAATTPAAEFQLTVCDRTKAVVRQFPQSFSVLGHPSLWRPRAAKQMLNHLRLLWLDGILDSAVADL